MSKHCFLRRHPGEGTPMILAIVLVLLMLFCTVAEFSRVWIIAQGVKEAAQQAVISTINDNYDDVYHAVREGYAAGWYPDGTGRWDEMRMIRFVLSFIDFPPFSDLSLDWTIPHLSA